jgi:MFS family permease
MREAVDLFRQEGRARVFFAVLTQSSLGTGAAYVALLLIAYERFHSPWAITLVLLADLVPAMLLGPVFGAAADRWSRRACMVTADLLRALAFAGIAIVSSFEATLALAVVAGVGTGLFTPSALAALPSLVEERRLPAATSVYGAITDLGFTAGPALAALVLLVGGPETIMLGNAVTFAVSTGVLAWLRFGQRPAGEAASRRSSLLRESGEGLRATADMPGIRVVLLGSAAALFFGGIFNVGELLFATGPLDASESGYSVLVAIFGLGFIAGSLTGSRGGDPSTLRRRFLGGMALMGAGFLASGLVPVFALALGTFALAGAGNGMLLVYERLLVQTTARDAVMGRVFGVKDALTAWAFGVAFLSAGGLIEALGTRELILLSGVGVLIVWVVVGIALNRAFPPERLPRRVALAGGADLLGYGGGRQDGSHVIDGREHWLALLDDLREGDDDIGVELRPRVGS